MSDIEVGKLIPQGGSLGRDAIHVAVLPVIARQILAAGDHIGLLPGSLNEAAAAAPPSIPALGIVDPYLEKLVQLGDCFYMFMYPRTITGLSHNWTHPALEMVEREQARQQLAADRLTMAKKMAASVSPREEQRVLDSVMVARSRAWIADWAANFGYDFEYVMEMAQTGFSGGSNVEGESIPTEFWTHYAILTGIVVPPERQQGYWSCSC